MLFKNPFKLFLQVEEASSEAATNGESDAGSSAVGAAADEAAKEPEKEPEEAAKEPEEAAKEPEEPAKEPEDSGKVADGITSPSREKVLKRMQPFELTEDLNDTQVEGNGDDASDAKALSPSCRSDATTLIMGESPLKKSVAEVRS